MTPENAAKRIRALAASKHADPEISALCAAPASVLAEFVREGDAVIWPADQGGLAWEILGRKRSAGGAGGNGDDGPSRIICVTLESFPLTEDLWRRLAEKAGSLGVAIRRVTISFCSGRTGKGGASVAASGETPRDGDAGFRGKRSLRGILAAFLGDLRDKLLERGESGAGENAPVAVFSDETAASGSRMASLDGEDLFIELPSTSGTPADGECGGASEKERGSAGNPAVPGKGFNSSKKRGKWAASIPEAYFDSDERNRPFHVIEPQVDVRERYLAAMVASCAGLMPVVSLFPEESAEGALYHSRFAGTDLPVITRTAGGWAAARGMSADEGTAVLTPVSPADIAGALEWSSENEGRILIVEPAEGDYARSATKQPWSEGEGVVIGRKRSGTAGRVALVAPGPLAKEVLKAAERLSKDNFSVTVFSLRFIAPLLTESLLALSEDHDLVCILDPDGGRSGRLPEAIEALFLRGKAALILPSAPHDGKSIASTASSAHRENRFRMAVDDVKQDRWR